MIAIATFVPSLSRRPEEIAVVAYLASPHSDCVSGAVLRVDGGTIRSVN
jgi:3-oxoacyl-[acyl-carrier protein] reductase